jgi:hypothetical protein
MNGARGWIADEGVVSARVFFETSFASRGRGKRVSSVGAKYEQTKTAVLGHLRGTDELAADRLLAIFGIEFVRGSERRLWRSETSRRAANGEWRTVAGSVADFGRVSGRFWQTLAVPPIRICLVFRAQTPKQGKTCENPASDCLELPLGRFCLGCRETCNKEGLGVAKLRVGQERTAQGLCRRENRKSPLSRISMIKVLPVVSARFVAFTNREVVSARTELFFPKSQSPTLGCVGAKVWECCVGARFQNRPFGGFLFSPKTPNTNPNPGFCRAQNSKGDPSVGGFGEVRRRHETGAGFV